MEGFTIDTRQTIIDEKYLPICRRRGHMGRVDEGG
jgi:hypothetical protein